MSAIASLHVTLTEWHRVCIGPRCRRTIKDRRSVCVLAREVRAEWAQSEHPRLHWYASLWTRESHVAREERALPSRVVGCLCAHSAHGQRSLPR